MIIDIRPTSLASLIDEDAMRATRDRVIRNGGGITAHNQELTGDPGDRKFMYGGEWPDHASAIKGLREGRAWPKTMESYREAKPLDDIGDVPAFRKARRHREWDDMTGDTADIGRALVAIAPWEQYRRTAAKRSVTVAFSIGLSAQSGDKEFRTNVVTVVALVDSLMAAGYDVRVVAALAVTQATFSCDEWDGPKPDWFGFSFPVKEFGGPMDQEAMLSIGTPSLLRHFGFVHLHHLFPNYKASDNVGSPRKWTPEVMKTLEADVMVAWQWREYGVGEEQFVANRFAEVQQLLESDHAPA